MGSTYLRRLGFASLLVLVLAAGCGSPQPTNLTPAPARNATRTPSAAHAAGTSRPARTATRTATPTSIPTSSLGVSTSDLQDIQVSFWHPWTGAQAELLTELVAEFNRENEWGLIVNLDTSGGYDALDQALLDSSASASPPSLIIAYSYQAAGWGDLDWQLAPFQEYVRDGLWGLSVTEQASFYAAFWPEAPIESLPAQRDAHLLYYNRTWAEELGFAAPPDTPEELQEQACRAANALREDEDPNNDGLGGLILSTDYPTFLGWLGAFEAPILSQNGESYRFNTPQTRAALEFVRSLYDQGCAWLAENSAPENEFAARQGLFASGSLTGIANQEAIFAEIGSRDEWAVLPFPGPQGAGAMPVYGPQYLLVDSNTAEELAAWLFVRWMYAPSQQARLVRSAYSFPLRADLADLLEPERVMFPQWNSAVGLLDLAQPEPDLASWRIVRWTVSDVATQLFRWYFDPEQLPATLRLWDQTAGELHEVGE